MLQKIIDKKAVVEKEIELLMAKKDDLDKLIKEKEKTIAIYDDLLEGEFDCEYSCEAKAVEDLGGDEESEEEPSSRIIVTPV